MTKDEKIVYTMVYLLMGAFGWGLIVAVYITLINLGLMSPIASAQSVRLPSGGEIASWSSERGTSPTLSRIQVADAVGYRVLQEALTVSRAVPTKIIAVTSAVDGPTSQAMTVQAIVEFTIKRSK